MGSRLGEMRLDGTIVSFNISRFYLMGLKGDIDGASSPGFKNCGAGKSDLHVPACMSQSACLSPHVYICMSYLA